MKDKRFWILLGVFLVLVILVIVSGRKPKPKVEPMFPDLQSDQVARIEITKGDQTTVLRKQAGQWLVASSDDYPADSDAVDKLLEKVAGFKKTLLESKNAKYHAKYGVDDEKGIQVKLLDANDVTLAHFYVGRSESDYTSSYVRQADADPVYRIPEYILSTFDKGSRGWRDHTIFKFNDYEISKLTVTSDTTNFTLEADRSSDEVKWSLTAPESAPAKKDVVERMANAFSTLQTDAFPDSQDLDADVTGLDAPTAKVEATLTDGTTRVLLIGKEKEGGSQYYVQRADKDTIFLLNKWRVNQFLKKVEDLKEEAPKEEPSKEETPKEEAPKEEGKKKPPAESQGSSNQESDPPNPDPETSSSGKAEI